MEEYPSADRRSLAGKSIAVVDSAYDSAELLKSWFEFCGARVSVATQLTQFRIGQADIRDWLALAQPDVVVFDIGPPYEANWTFLEQLRDGPLRRIPLVVTTTNEAVLRRLTEPGADIPIQQLVGKPYDLDELAECVARLVAAAGR